MVQSFYLGRIKFLHVERPYIYTHAVGIGLAPVFPLLLYLLTVFIYSFIYTYYFLHLFTSTHAAGQERLPPIPLPRSPGEVHISGGEGRHPAGEGGAPPAPHPHCGVQAPHAPRGIWGGGGVGVWLLRSFGFPKLYSSKVFVLVGAIMPTNSEPVQ